MELSWKDRQLLVELLSKTLDQVRDVEPIPYGSRKETSDKGVGSMTSVTVVLPDELVRQAKAAGLLTESALETLLRRVLQQQSASERLDEIFARLDATGELPLSDKEVAEEIAAARRDRARRR